MKHHRQTATVCGYTAISLKQKVPFLVVDGKGLSENVALQTWIAEVFPNANLMPSDSWNNKHALSYMSWFGSGPHPHMTRFFKPIKFCGHVEVHDEIKAKAKAWYLEQLELVENELQGKTWFFDHYTVCDSRGRFHFESFFRSFEALIGHK